MTGDPEDVLDLAAVLGVRYKPDGSGGFSHSNVITVLDREGVVYYQQLGAGDNRSATIAALRELLPD